MIAKFFEQNTNLRSLEWIRMVCGGCLFFHYLALLPHLPFLFGPEGLNGLHFTRELSSMGSIARGSNLNFDFLRQVSSFELIALLYGLLLLSSLSFALGFRTRFVGLVALALHFLFHARLESAVWGWGTLVKPLIGYLLLSSTLGKTMSLDCKIKTGKWVNPDLQESEGPVWPLRLLQIHVVLIYVVSAWARIGDPDWLSGSVFYEILVHSYYGRINSDWRAFMPILELFCFAAWFVEFLAPLLLLPSRLIRSWIAIFLILMHATLEMTAMVGYWNFLMIAALLPFIDVQLIKARLQPFLFLTSRQRYSTLNR